jgi:hypothetical protein
MTPSHAVPRHHHPEHPTRSKNVVALLALLLSTLLLMLAARISHADPAEPSVSRAVTSLRA